MRKTYAQMIKCNCATANALAVIGGKWKILILYHLLSGEKRFNQLSRLLSSITAHTLSKDLQELEADGLILKHDYHSLPRRTGYTLSEKGRELESILIGIREFGKKYPLQKTEQ